jgi:chromosome segregation ATPase
MSSVITHKPPGPGDTYENPEQVSLLDASGNPTGFSIGAGRHVPQPVTDTECSLKLLQSNADLRICRASLSEATTDLSAAQTQLAATEAALTAALRERDAAAAERDSALGTVADLQNQLRQLQALLDTCEGHPPNLACQADLSSDGIVNFKDLALFKSVFFKRCEPTP